MSETPPTGSPAPESTRKAFPLRISQRLYDAVRQWADDELRSVNSQIEYILAEAVRRRNRTSGKPDRPGPDKDHGGRPG